MQEECLFVTHLKLLKVVEAFGLFACLFLCCFFGGVVIVACCC